MSITIEATEASRRLESLRLDNLQKEKDIQKIIRTVLSRARAQISKDAKAQMSNDPRQAYKAVRSSVYRRILGGQVNILAPKRASNMRASVKKDRKIDRNPHQRGGNRRARSQRTEQIDSYWGKDRGFILRFQNAGTSARETRYGGRGRISARNWFGSSSHTAMQQASEELATLIDQAIKEVWG